MAKDSSLLRRLADPLRMTAICIFERSEESHTFSRTLMTKNSIFAIILN
jgi:hypothetical protein